jgi:hypothetical protein
MIVRVYYVFGVKSPIGFVIVYFPDEYKHSAHRLIPVYKLVVIVFLIKQYISSGVLTGYKSELSDKTKSIVY